MKLITFLKNWTLPSAIVIGSVSYLTFAYVPALDAAGDALSPIFETLLPITIFFTLFVTFSKVDFHLMRLCRWHFKVLGIQLLLIALLTGVIHNLDFITPHFQFSIVNYPFLKLLLAWQAGRKFAQKWSVWVQNSATAGRWVMQRTV